MVMLNARRRLADRIPVPAGLLLSCVPGWNAGFVRRPLTHMDFKPTGLERLRTFAPR